MATAFVQFYENEVRDPERVPGGRRVLWRLLAANNRELGRGLTTFGSLAAAIEGVERDLARLGELRRSRVVSEADNLWRWHLTAPEGLVASAHRGYYRRAECLLALDQFLLQAPTAALREQIRVVPGDGRRSSFVREDDLGHSGPGGAPAEARAAALPPEWSHTAVTGHSVPSASTLLAGRRAIDTSHIGGGTTVPEPVS